MVSIYHNQCIFRYRIFLNFLSAGNFLFSFLDLDLFNLEIFLCWTYFASENYKILAEVHGAALG